MSLIKVKYKNSAYKPGFFASYEPEYKIYVGHVVPRQSWLSKDEFFLTTGEYDAPVRILDKRDIVEAWVDRSNRPDNVTVVDNKYVVTAGPFNRHSCTCTAYKYRSKCSHIDEVKHG
jgi:hypothetical protein